MRSFLTSLLIGVCGVRGVCALAAPTAEPEIPISPEVPEVVAYAATTYTEAGRRAGYPLCFTTEPEE